MKDINKHRLLLLLAAALLFLLSACQSSQPPTVRAFATATATRTPVPTRKASPTPALSPTPRLTRTPMKTPTPVYPAPVDLFELLKAGSVEVIVVPKDINDLSLHLKSNVDHPLSVRVPAGTYFVSESPRYQNMISLETEIGELDADGRDTLFLNVACANIDRSIPDEDVDYSVRASSGVAELDAAMPFLEEANLRYESNQALIWILTDDASYEELGRLVRRSGFSFSPSPLGDLTRVIDAIRVIEAFQVLDKAGIDITGRKIWLDRDSVAGVLDGSRHPTLQKWLQNYIQKNTK